jgi:hypothetical protein
MRHADTSPIIADRGEFIDALGRLQAGHTLVRLGDDDANCVLDGARLYHSFRTLRRYRLIDRYENPQGFAGAEYYRLSEAGQQFARQAHQTWRAQPFLRRMMVRLVG